MAGIEQRITIGFNPHDLDALTKAIQRGMAPQLTEALGRPNPYKPEPITIETPVPSLSGRATGSETRYLFIDGDNQEHWVPSIVQGRDRGWRQAFFLPGR